MIYIIYYISDISDIYIYIQTGTFQDDCRLGTIVAMAKP